jgi:RNA polymerase sigma-70 factor (ECF subfamily)
MPAERTNEEWLRDLSSTGPAQQQALEDLRNIILSSLRYGLARWLEPGDPRFEPLATEVAQEALLRILDRLDSFEGRSKFTTWVYTIAVRLGLSELRKARWREVSLDNILEENPNFFPAAAGEVHFQGDNPEIYTEKLDLMQHIERVIAEELTEKQRTALIALGIKGMSMEAVAEQMGTNRNALYKLMHDARVRLKKRLAAEGMLSEDILATFE